jgi:acyl-lipid omega-3 desaturase
MEELEKLPFTL